ncbi:MAG TPA: LysE family transporter, partial [Candidatus Acidoferrales bacterium]|nr:LysE family transporter [Candidatus Acidoferrales bacterium]
MEHHPILLAGLTGYVIAALFSSIPVGPINLTILNEGACRGFRWAMMIGLGAASMEVIYCALSFTGFSTLFADTLVKAIMQLFTFLFLLFIGMKFLAAPTVNVPTKLDSASKKIEAKLGKKLHPHNAFTTGFVRVMGNLGVLLTWIVLTGNFMAHDWVANSFAAKAACVAGVALGTTT